MEVMRSQFSNQLQNFQSLNDIDTIVSPVLKRVSVKKESESNRPSVATVKNTQDFTESVTNTNTKEKPKIRNSLVIKNVPARVDTFRE